MLSWFDLNSSTSAKTHCDCCPNRRCPIRVLGWKVTAPLLQRSQRQSSPYEYTSIFLAPSNVCPRRCHSGALHGFVEGILMKSLARVHLAEYAKSMIFVVRPPNSSSKTRTLSGFISPCTTSVSEQLAPRGGWRRVTKNTYCTYAMC
jgi:hypothetical protein